MPVAILIALTALGGLAIWYLGAPSKTFFTEQELNKAEREANQVGITETVALKKSTQDALVMRYIMAYRSGNCSDIIAITQWAQDRLEAKPDPATRENLCSELLRRSPDDTQVDLLGIEDQYLIPNTVDVKIIGADPGRDDLALPVQERVWVQFSYSNKATAPRSPSGKSIKKIRAGLNVSETGTVLKGGVIGNWEIDIESIQLHD